MKFACLCTFPLFRIVTDRLARVAAHPGASRMGCDGGSIPTRRELVRTSKKAVLVRREMSFYLLLFLLPHTLLRVL